MTSWTVEFYRSRFPKLYRVEWRWRVRAANGRVIASSTEGYYNFQDMRSNFTVVTGIQSSPPDDGPTDRMMGTVAVDEASMFRWAVRMINWN